MSRRAPLTRMSLRGCEKSSDLSEELSARACSWPLSLRIKLRDGRAQMLAQVGSNHRAHPALLCREVSGKSADVNCGECGGESISVRFECAVSLHQKACDDAGQRITCASRAESGIACRIDEDATIRRRDERARTLEDKNERV